MKLQDFIDLFRSTKKSPQVVGMPNPAQFVQLTPTASHLILEIKEVYIDEAYRRFFSTPPFSTSPKGHAIAWQDVTALLLPELDGTQIPHALTSMLRWADDEPISPEETAHTHHITEDGEGVQVTETSMWEEVRLALPALEMNRGVKVVFRLEGTHDLHLDVFLLGMQGLKNISEMLSQHGLMYPTHDKKKPYGLLPTWVLELHQALPLLKERFEASPKEVVAFLQAVQNWANTQDSHHELQLDDRRLVGQRTIYLPRFTPEARPNLEDPTLSDFIPFHDDLPTLLGCLDKEEAIQAIQRAMRYWDGNSGTLQVETATKDSLLIVLTPKMKRNFAFIKENATKEEEGTILNLFLKKEGVPLDADFEDVFDIDLNHYGERVIGVGPPIKMVGAFGKTDNKSMLDGIDVFIEDTGVSIVAEGGKPFVKFEGFSEAPIYLPPDKLEPLEEQAQKAHQENTLLSIFCKKTEQPVALDLNHTHALEIFSSKIKQAHQKWKTHSLNPNRQEKEKTCLPEKAERLVLQILMNQASLDYSTLTKDDQEKLNALLWEKLKLKPDFNLFDYQKEGVGWLLLSFMRGRSGVLLADDMGLGKTLQTLCFLRLIMQTYWKERCEISPLNLDAQAFESALCKHPILIVVPPILLDNFEKQAQAAFENARDFKFLQLHGKNIRSYFLESKFHLKGTELTLGRQALLDTDKLSAFRCIVITYDTLVNYQYSLAQVSWSVVLCDEVQKAKSTSTNVSQSLKAVASKAMFTLLMSGTPIENNMNELWNIMDTAVAGLLGSLTAFRNTYKPFFKESDAKEKEKAFEELNQALKFGCFSEGFANGRLKEKVAQGLPQKIETDILVELQAETIKEIRQIYRSNQTAVQKIGRIKQLSVHPFLYQSFQRQNASVEEWIQASHRLQRLEELLKDISTKQEKALVFCEWHRYQNVVQAFVNERYGIDLTAINSQVSLEERQAVLAKFQETKGFSALVLSPKCAGMGLNLQEANHVIHLTRWWNPAVEDQATCRAYRTGQKKDVFVYYFVAEHPFEQNLNERIKQKRALRSNLFDLEYVTPIKAETLLSPLEPE